MSRVRIIFLNRSCAQLHSLSLLPPPTTSSSIPTTATAYLVERVINCHNSCTLSVTLLLETLEQNAPLARAFLSMFVSSRLAPHVCQPFWQLGLPAVCSARARYVHLHVERGSVI